MIPKRFADKNFEGYEAIEKGQYQALKSCLDFAQELKLIGSAVKLFYWSVLPEPEKHILPAP